MVYLAANLSERHKASFLAWARRVFFTWLLPDVRILNKHDGGHDCLPLWDGVPGASLTCLEFSVPDTGAADTMVCVILCNDCPTDISHLLFHRSFPSQMQSQNISQFSS